MALSAGFHDRHEVIGIALTEFSIALFFTYILFSLISLLRYLYIILILLFFCFGGASNYYIYNFGKVFDIGVLQDIISVELDLTLEYLSFKLVLFIFISLALSLFIIFSKKFRFKKPYHLALIATIIASYLVATYFDYKKHKLYINRIVPQSYMPFNVFYNTDLYMRKYGVFNKQKAEKVDLTKNFTFQFQNDGSEPKVIVLVIGEAMRGDMFYLNGKTNYLNAPQLSKIKNLKSFKDATSSASSTRVALPYMLTRAKSGDWEQAISEKSIISVFKSLGFKTAWIGAQGAFTNLDYTYGPIIMEADEIITKTEIRKDLGQSNLYDEYLLLYLDKFLQKNQADNLFIVLHMIGSHWNFDERYPEKFKNFTPTCESSSPASCAHEQLLNSYHNTIFYSDWVLSKIIERFENKNAFLMYASDHGFSLFEKHYFGNAYEGKDDLKEQYDIAMFAWGSNKYIKKNSNAFKAIKSQNKVSHDYLFHSLLGCSNVESKVIEQNLNLCYKRNNDVKSK
ncbi:phosphoethanolamine transferase [Candidatus Jidaibacter acanthamoebae]|nr:phosphoethanolamine transferase [Candidatus Jidaibacter acanthamoeba]